MNSKLDTRHLLFYVSRIFRGYDPDIIEKFPLRPIEKDDVVIGSLAPYAECISFYNQVNIIERSAFKGRMKSSTDLFKGADRMGILMKVLNFLLWESAYHCLPITDEYDNADLHIKGDFEVVTKKWSVRFGPDGLADSHPIRRFYGTLSKILRGDSVFEGNLRVLGLEGMLIGHVTNDLVRQIHYFWQYMQNCFRRMTMQGTPESLVEVFSGRPAKEHMRYGATFQHVRDQLWLVNQLTIMALELEDVDHAGLRGFMEYNGGRAVMLINEKWEIICVSVEDFMQR